MALKLQQPNEHGLSVVTGMEAGVSLEVEERTAGGRQVIAGLRLRVDGRPLRSGDLHGVPLTAIEHALNDPLRRAAIDGVRGANDMADAVRAAAQHRTAGRLIPPERRPYPDEFFEGVAGIYRDLVAGGVSPAPAMAEQAGVPVSTIHGWVKEARRRGALPAGRKGKAG